MTVRTAWVRGGQSSDSLAARLRNSLTVLAWCNALPAKVQYNDPARIELKLEGKGPYWKSSIWNVSVGTAGFFAT